MSKFLLGFLSGALLPLIATAGLCLSGWAGVDATSMPPKWEAAIAERCFTTSVARQAPKLVSPVAADSENLRAGMKIFRDSCAGCHGDAVTPSRWGTTSFYPRVPQFGSAPPDKPDWQLFWIVKHGVRYTGMGGCNGLLADSDIWKVAEFLSHLRNLPPDVDAEWHAHPAAR